MPKLAILFTLLGWLLAVTAVGLLLVPWRRHQRFAGWAIPLALRRLRLVAAGAAAPGGLILHGVSRALIG